jgi:hypothetical protein
LKPDIIPNEDLFELIMGLEQKGVTHASAQSEILAREHGIEIKPHLLSEFRYRESMKRFYL